MLRRYAATRLSYRFGAVLWRKLAPEKIPDVRLKEGEVPLSDTSVSMVKYVSKSGQKSEAVIEIESKAVTSRLTTYYVHLAEEDTTTHHHRDGNDGQVDPGKLHAANLDMFPGQYVSPKQARQRSAESRAEGSIVDTKCHRVDCGPEGTVRDTIVVHMNLHPGLDNT